MVNKARPLISNGAAVLLAAVGLAFTGVLLIAYTPGPTQRGTAVFSHSNITPAPTDHERRQGGPDPAISVHAVHFDLCRRRMDTCVIDGDTFRLDGVRYRIADIDAPEVRSPRCDAEKALGQRATLRLLDLLNAGPFELRTLGTRTQDRYGRSLRVVERNGMSLGQQLVEEGLAQAWRGRKASWC